MTTERTFPSEVIDLPSQGWYYDQSGPLASGKIELKYLTAKEEDILTSRNLITKGLVLDKLMESLIVDKGINISELLVSDKDAIMVASRILGYGKDYAISVICPVCGERNDTSVDLTKVEEKKVPEPTEKGKNSLTFTLPFSKAVVTYKLLTHADEQAVSAELAALRKAGMTEVDKTLTTRLKQMIVSVNGDASPATIRDFIDNRFLARDARMFREEYNKMNPGMDLSFAFTCKKCGEGRRMALPIGLDFFWPDSGV